MRSDRWPKWACRRAPTESGGTARTLAGSVRYYKINYTALADLFAAEVIAAACIASPRPPALLALQYGFLTCQQARPIAFRWP